MAGSRLSIRVAVAAICLLCPASLGWFAQSSGGPTPDWVVEGPQGGTDFGQSIAAAGDVDGDGYADVIIGDSGTPYGPATPGLAYLHAGSRTGLSVLPTLVLGGPHVGSFFGYSVAGAGDVNGDGYDDVVVGAPLAANGTSRGAAFLYYGSAIGLSSVPSWVSAGIPEAAGAGSVVDGAGDINGDGYDDLLVTAGDVYFGGRVLVYLGSASGPAPVPSWTAVGAADGDGFGSAAGPAGDVNRDGFADIIVGAPFRVEGRTNGRAEVYFGSADGLSPVADWTAGSEILGGAFGSDVSGAGDVNGDGFADLVIADRSYGQIFYDEGRVYVYFGSPSGPAASPGVTIDGTRHEGLSSKAFGFSVAGGGDIDGDGIAEVLVSSLYYDGYHGGMFLFRGTPSGPEREAIWIAEGDSVGALFGWTIEFAGDVDGDGSDDAMVTTLSGTGRVGLYRLRPQSHTDIDGDLVPDGSDNCLKVGNRDQSDGDGDAVGDVCDVCPEVPDILQYDYDDDEVGNLCDNCPEAFSPNPLQEDADGDGLGDVCDLCPSDADPTQQDADADFVGDACEADDDQDGVPDAEDNCPGDANPGQEDGDHDGIGDACEALRRHRQAIGGTQQGAQFGRKVASAGDVNGDGFGEVLVGEPNYSGAHYEQGRAMLFLGSATGLETGPAWVVEGASLLAGLGDAVAGAGDVDGDGFDDVLIGAPSLDYEHAGAGRAYLYRGSPAGPGPNPVWIGEGEAAFASFGEALAGAGDINADGYDDVVVGSPGYFRGTERYGRAYLYLGSNRGLSQTPVWVSDGDPDSYLFGASLASAGDVNGDGFGDLVVGGWACCYSEETGRTSGRGRVYLFLGSVDGPSVLPAWTADGEKDYTYLGYAVAGAGDVNGDGLDDVLVSTPYDSTAPHYSNGLASLYLGSSSGLSAAAAWTVTGSQNSAALGGSVGPAGDINNDGYDDYFVADLIITTIGGGEVQHGRVAVYHGSPAGPIGPVLTAVDRQAWSGFGFAASPAGDVRGDGTPDLMVGAWSYDFGSPDVGAVFIYELSADGDGDGVPDAGDNCPATKNVDQDPCACQQCGLSDSVISFTSVLGKGSGTVGWTTINEFEVTGFNIIEINAAGDRIQKNPVLIPCEECITGLSRSYAYIVPKHRGGRDIFIEMVLRDGTVRRFGPARRE